MTVDEAFAIIDRMDPESTAKFNVQEQQAIIRLGTEIVTRGSASERIEKFLRARGLLPDLVH